MSMALLASCGPSEGTGKLGPPESPREVKFRIVPEGLEVSWDTVPGATHYAVFWGTETGKYDRMFTAPDTCVVITGLGRGELYALAVTSWNHDGESDYSPEAVVVYDDEPRRATAHLAKGDELLAQGSLELADAYLSAAIRLDPDSVQAYRSRALLNEKLNRPEPARKDHAAAERLIKQQKVSLRQAAR
jgi:tetratricopeptide (TPR) repeat protein